MVLLVVSSALGAVLMIRLFDVIHVRPPLLGLAILFGSVFALAAAIQLALGFRGKLAIAVRSLAALGGMVALAAVTFAWEPPILFVPAEMLLGEGCVVRRVGAATLDAAADSDLGKSLCRKGARVEYEAYGVVLGADSTRDAVLLVAKDGREAKCGLLGGMVMRGRRHLGLLGWRRNELRLPFGLVAVSSRSLRGISFDKAGIGESHPPVERDGGLEFRFTESARGSTNLVCTVFVRLSDE